MLAPAPAPSASDSPLSAESIPLLDNAVPLLGLTAAKGAIAPVTGLVGSAPGVVKGALGSATGTLNGLLGGTPVGGLVNGAGIIGTGLAGGLLDSRGGVAGGAGGGLGLGQILKPVTGTVGGLLNGLPIVGPIAGPVAGGLTDTLGGLSLAQINEGQVGQMNVPSDPAQAQYPVPGMGMPSSSLPGFPGTTLPGGQSGSAFVAQAQAVQEQVVGNLGGGSFLTNTGRIVSLLPAGAGSALPAGLGGAASGLPGSVPAGLTGPLSGLTGNSGPLGGLTGNGGPLAGLPVQMPSGLPGLDGLGQALRPITSSPLTQTPLAGAPLGQAQSPLDLGNLAGIVSSLPPGLSQIVQPIGSAQKFLQIGNQLIPLGAMDPTRLAQLGLDKLPVSTVNSIPGLASINYLQDQGQDTDESKGVKANPVTTWMNEGDAAGNSTTPATTTPVDSTDATPTAGAGAGDAGAEPSVSDAPQIAQLNIQPLYVAPTPSTAAAQAQAPKGFTQWSEISLNEGETFDRIADGMSGRERNYYSSSSTVTSNLPSATPTETPFPVPSGATGNGTAVEDGPAPEFHANKGRIGWQLVDESNEPSSSSGWHHVGPSATATATGTTSSSSAVRVGPTAAPVSDAGTYAWDEDWGDWV